MAGKTNGDLDMEVLKAKMDEYAGLDCNMSPYTDDAGTSYDNYQLIMMDYLTYGE